jgi:hypothetical protein
MIKGIQVFLHRLNRFDSLKILGSANDSEVKYFTGGIYQVPEIEHYV